MYSLQGMASHNTEALVISEADFTTDAMVNTSAIVAWHADRVDPVVGRPAGPERVALADSGKTSPIRRCISLIFSFDRGPRRSDASR